MALGCLLLLVGLSLTCPGLCFLSNTLHKPRDAFLHLHLHIFPSEEPFILAKTTESFKLSDLYVMEAQLQVRPKAIDTFDDTQQISVISVDPNTGSYLLRIASDRLIHASCQKALNQNFYEEKFPSCLNRFDWFADVLAIGNSGQRLIDVVQTMSLSTSLIEHTRDFSLDYICMGNMNEKDYSSSKRLLCRMAQCIPSPAALDESKARTKLILIETPTKIYLAKQHMFPSFKSPGIQDDTFDVAKRWPKRPFQYSSAMNPIVAEIVIDILRDLTLRSTQKKITLLDPTMGSGTFLAFALERGMHVTGYDIKNKCVNGTLSNLAYIFGKEYLEGRCDVSHGDSTSSFVDSCDQEQLFDTAVTNLPWGQNTEIQNENDNQKILEFTCNRLCKHSYFAIVSKYDPSYELESLDVNIIHRASIPQANFKLPSKKKKKQKNLGASNCIVTLCRKV